MQIIALSLANSNILKSTDLKAYPHFLVDNIQAAVEPQGKDSLTSMQAKGMLASAGTTG